MGKTRCHKQNFVFRSRRGFRGISVLGKRDATWRRSSDKGSVHKNPLSLDPKLPCQVMRWPQATVIEFPSPQKTMSPAFDQLSDRAHSSLNGGVLSVGSNVGVCGLSQPPGRSSELEATGASSRRGGHPRPTVLSLLPAGCFVWVFGTQGLHANALVPPTVRGMPEVSVHTLGDEEDEDTWAHPPSAWTLTFS